MPAIAINETVHVSSPCDDAALDLLVVETIDKIAARLRARSRIELECDVDEFIVDDLGFEPMEVFMERIGAPKLLSV